MLQWVPVVAAVLVPLAATVRFLLVGLVGQAGLFLEPRMVVAVEAARALRVLAGPVEEEALLLDRGALIQAAVERVLTEAVLLLVTAVLDELL